MAGAVQLPDATALDGELVVWDTAGRLAFERLQTRLPGVVPGRPGRRRSGRLTSPRSICCACLGRTRPGGRTGGAGPHWSGVFAARRLSAPWTLSPSTTEADVVRERPTWAPVGMEGIVFKRLNDATAPR
ncbi:hypothetical protein [Streptomyces lacrimifluminis]|uniref:hypothetical protein n=1 Tax=Streptomyces lacrimifluminis TaxID=1500077 RepID=UPI00166F38E6|nr:hypothetical protein [Streptomyces lacrimifluminis]